MGSAGDRRGKAGEERIARRGQRRLLGNEGDYDERERERETEKGEACFLCISPRIGAGTSTKQHPSIQHSHLPPATYPSAQPLK